MKKLVYFFAGLVMCVGSAGMANAQSASFLTSNTGSDTTSVAWAPGSADVHVANGLKSASSNTVYVRWTMSNAVLPSGVTLSFCDNSTCLSSLGNGSSNIAPYTNSAFGTFYASFEHMDATPNNSHAWVRVLAVDTVTHYSRILTFHAYKGALGIVTTTVSDDNVMLYPNPARDAVNVTYSPNAGVKNIAIYNLIGRAVKIFRPLDDNGAKLDIDNIPTGVYFVRLMDANGHVVATRRFTRQ